MLTVSLATLPFGLDSNVTKQQANLLINPLYFIILPIIVSCNLVSIKLLLLLLIGDNVFKQSLY